MSSHAAGGNGEPPRVSKCRALRDLVQWLVQWFKTRVGTLRLPTEAFSDRLNSACTLFAKNETGKLDVESQTHNQTRKGQR
jgi:hypothetical protein